MIAPITDTAQLDAAQLDAAQLDTARLPCLPVPPVPPVPPVAPSVSDVAPSGIDARSVALLPERVEAAPLAAGPVAASGQDRRGMREERRQARRQRRVAALWGLAVLGLLLGATVVVLDVVR